MGFAFVSSGPFVRSSYNAVEFSKKVMGDRLAQLDEFERAKFLQDLEDQAEAEKAPI